MKKLLILTFLLIFIACSKDNTGISNNLPTPKNQINIKENGLKSVYSKIEKTINTFEYKTDQGMIKATDEKTFYPSGNLNSNKITEYNITIDDSKPSLIIEESFLDKDKKNDPYSLISYRNFLTYSNYNHVEVENIKYNDQGLLFEREIIYPNQISTFTYEYDFDEINRPIKRKDYSNVYDPNTGDYTGEEYLSHYYDILYNAQGKISQISNYYTQSKDEVFRKTSETFATYYSHGGLKEIKIIDSYGSLEKITYYNQFGDLEKIIHFNNGEVSSIVEYTYFDTYYTIKKIGTDKKSLDEIKYVIENNKIIAKVSTYTNYVNLGGEWVEGIKETEQITVIPR